LKTAVAARNISARDTIVSLIANLASFVTVCECQAVPVLPEGLF
jgi:hypothetical protein